MTEITETVHPSRRGDELERALRAAVRGEVAKFVVGAEGTLLVATHAVVDLVPKPRRTVYAVGHFTSTPGAIRATEDALSCAPHQVELMDKTILDLSRRKIEYADLGNYLVGDPAALLFVSFSGDDEAELVGKLDRLIALWARNGHGYHSLRAVTPAEQTALLKVRKSSLGVLMAAGEGTRRPPAFVEDTAVDPVHLADYTKRFSEILDEHRLDAGFYGHSSAGCLHIRPFLDLTDPDQFTTMRVVAESTSLRFEVVGGMRDAADRCMNIGLCRKSATGVMCPSYIATTQEEHSTRGRANALVKALSEPDPHAALGGERPHDILDLCLMCKACKTECPMGVDMAALKAETLHHRHQTHGVPLRSRVFGAIRLLNRLGYAGLVGLEYKAAGPDPFGRLPAQRRGTDR